MWFTPFCCDKLNFFLLTFFFVRSQWSWNWKICCHATESFFYTKGLCCVCSSPGNLAHRDFKNASSKLVEFIIISIFPLNIWLGKFYSLLCEFNPSIAVYHSWWPACFAPCESHAECWSCTSPASCSCCSNCTTWSQNLCKNCPAQSWATPYRIFDMKLA